ncbi:MAG: class I SAM-dependent methyltransferase [Gemmataceae bacterium]
MTTAVNYWRDDKCAKAFWGQHEMPAYQELMRDTLAWLEPEAGQRWLDLGCGAGRLSQALWTKSDGALAEVVGLDCAALNAQSYETIRKTARIDETRFRFEHVDFSRGLPQASDRFDGAVSGLAIQYAESFNAVENRWTREGYDALLEEIFRVLKPGGHFVFSVNVPNPSWGKVAMNALGNLFRAPRKLRYLKKLWRMWSYGGWLKREARKGRFHYLPEDMIDWKLRATGFEGVESRLSFAGQAYLFRCRKTTDARRAPSLQPGAKPVYNSFTTQQACSA